MWSFGSACVGVSLSRSFSTDSFLFFAACAGVSLDEWGVRVCVLVCQSSAKTGWKFLDQVSSSLTHSLSFSVGRSCTKSSGKSSVLLFEKVRFLTDHKRSQKKGLWLFKYFSFYFVHYLIHLLADKFFLFKKGEESESFLRKRNCENILLVSCFPQKLPFWLVVIIYPHFSIPPRI